MTPQSTPAVERRWPEQGFTRIPAWIYTDPDLYRRELDTFFAGDSWNFVGLECELPEVGSYKRAWIADRQVIVVRDADGINVLENRCAHRGGAIMWQNKGQARSLVCPYHQWGYDLKGELRGVALKRGVHGEGGMPDDFDAGQFSLRRLRVARFGGSIWATFSDETPPFEEYCGPAAMQRLHRMMPGKPLRLLGQSRQLIPCNWKLYFENTRDPYHGTLLHTFFITFGLYRADSRHVTSPTEGGKHSVNYAAPGERKGDGTSIKAELKRFRDIKLNDMETVTFVDEYGDGEMTAMQLFPGAFVQQHANILALRSIIPKGVGETEIDWTYFGYAEDDERMQRIRLKQANLLGPSGFVSMDDSELLKQMQAQVAGAPESVGVVEMGGRDVQPQVTMATEVGIRAFYDFYRRKLGL
ncbi:MAG TPA: SRPBCC family protein [Ramlibacter sp.]|nr:SRPBCC family protein [Ramlibacter sp.]